MRQAFPGPDRPAVRHRLTLLASILAGSVLLNIGCAAASRSGKVNAPAQSAESAKAAAQRISERASSWRTRQGNFFKRNWGVELIGVHPVSSGYMLALRYRILDPDKAKVLNNRHSKAYLIDEATGTVLAVPAMENIGELRPGSTPEANRNYFMVFGNPGKVVKAGSTVSLVAGDFRADGVVVE